MATFFKYIERQADSYVNWADIGKNMTDMISEQNKVREEKKAAIDKSQKDLLEYVNANVPNGSDANARTRALELADNASKYMLMQNRLLKSGRISVKDYTIGRDNLESSTKNAYLAMQDYQAKYTEYMQRAQDGVSSKGELGSLTDAEGFGNWNQSGFYVNPASGEVMIGLMDQETVNGQTVWKMSQNPNKLVPTNYVKGLINTKWDKYNTETAVSNWATTLGEMSLQKVVTKSGLFNLGEIAMEKDITKRTDIDEKTKQVIYEFQKAEKDWIQSTLTNPFNKASVLLDRVGKAANGQEYFLTNDESVANSNPAAILRIIDPNTKAVTGFKFQDSQTEAAEQFMFNMARSQYGRSREVQMSAQLSRNEESVEGRKFKFDIKNRKKNSETFLEQYIFLLTGNDAQSEAARSWFTGKGFNLGKTGTLFEVATKDGVNSLLLTDDEIEQGAAGLLGMFTGQLGQLVDADWLDRNTRARLREFKRKGGTLNSSATFTSYDKEVTKKAP